LALGGGVFTLTALVWLLLSGSDQGSREGPAASAAVTAEGAARAIADRTLRSGETLAIAAAALPSDRPVILDLRLAEPSKSADPLAGRILTAGRPPLEFEGAIQGEDRGRARVGIDSDWLSPGRYVIEIETTERSHFPVRRFALEVR
jgi:hypothetical protein